MRNLSTNDAARRLPHVFQSATGLLLLVVTCLALSACGGGDPEDEQEPTTCTAQQCGRTN